MTDRATDYLATRGISEYTCLLMGVGYEPRLDAVCFTYHDALSRPQGARWRFLAPGATPKYLSERGKKVRLYNVMATDSPIVYICEGETDTLTLVERGLQAVGVPGANTFKDGWRWLFCDKEVRIAFDPDEAGLTGAHKIARMLGSVASDVEILSLPQGFDVNACHMAGTLGEYL